jgi:predicted DCC family thiol-disulfide oxidoreductase YuxK
VQKDILLFDGVCNLCNSSINFVIDHDPSEKFKFAALQSEFGQKKLKELNLDPKDFDSIVLLSNNQIHVKSTAALKVAKELTGGWPMLYAFIIVPPFIRHAVYNLIAKNRYKIWGRTDQCRVPTPELKQRFIEG